MEDFEIKIKEFRDNTAKNCQKNKAQLNEYLSKNEGKKEEIVKQIELVDRIANLTNELCELYLSHSTDTRKINELNEQLKEANNEFIASYALLPHILSKKQVPRSNQPGCKDFN